MAESLDQVKKKLAAFLEALGMVPLTTPKVAPPKEPSPTPPVQAEIPPAVASPVEEQDPVAVLKALIAEAAGQLPLPPGNYSIAFAKTPEGEALLAAEIGLIPWSVSPGGGASQAVASAPGPVTLEYTAGQDVALNGLLFTLVGPGTPIYEQSLMEMTPPVVLKKGDTIKLIVLPPGSAPAESEGAEPLQTKKLSFQLVKPKKPSIQVLGVNHYVVPSSGGGVSFYKHPKGVLQHFGVKITDVPCRQIVVWALKHQEVAQTVVVFLPGKTVNLLQAAELASDKEFWS